MDLQFERGRADAPTGHALVYFTSSVDRAVLATYVVVLPITLQLSKYVPPMLAAQLPLGEMQGIGAVPVPPIPEAVESQAYLAGLAELRQDDLIAAGSLNPGDVHRAMSAVAELAQRYAQLYEEYHHRASTPSATREEEVVTDTTVSDVIYGLMSEQQKLAELAKLAGQLRYAVDGGDQHQVEDLVAEVQRLARHLPPSYDLEAFLRSARRSGPDGQRLSTLYLDRCYKLAGEDYPALRQIDDEIRRLEDGS